MSGLSADAVTAANEWQGAEVEHRRPRLGGRALLILPTLVLLLCFFVLPYVNMVVMSFRNPSTSGVFAPGYTIGNYARALSDPYYLGVLGQTLLLGVVISAICLVVGYPVAYHLARTRSRFKGLLYAGVLSPLLVGVVVRCYGWTILLANNGLINQAAKGSELFPHGIKLMYNTFGVSVGLVHVFLPFMILPLLSTIQSIDPGLEEAARSLGASRVKSFFRVTLPLSLPGIQSGTILVFMLTISAYVIPVLLGAMRVKILPTIVIQLLIDAFLWPFGAALALILSIAGALSVFLFLRLCGRYMKGIA
ncbi:MAG: ABC transporter permease [Rhizobiaceae bacterium]|jgi:putative spermidine/putrescine transport system permease protein